MTNAARLTNFPQGKNLIANYSDYLEERKSVLRNAGGALNAESAANAYIAANRPVTVDERHEYGARSQTDAYTQKNENRYYSTDISISSLELNKLGAKEINAIRTRRRELTNELLNGSHSPAKTTEIGQKIGELGSALMAASAQVSSKDDAQGAMNETVSKLLANPKEAILAQANQSAGRVLDLTR